MSKKRVLLVRHGETDYNIERRWQGQLDVPLNDNGRRQAHALAGYLQHAGIEVAYASDLRRAYETAQIIVAPHRTPVIGDKRLREFRLGIIEGLRSSEMTGDLSDHADRWRADDDYPIPQGESRRQTQRRVFEFWQDVISQHESRTILIVSHGGTQRMLFRKLFGDDQDFHFSNTSLSILESSDNVTWQIVSLGVTPHLDEE